MKDKIFFQNLRFINGTKELFNVLIHCILLECKLPPLILEYSTLKFEKPTSYLIPLS